MAWRLDHLQDLLLIGAALIHCHYINQSEFMFFFVSTNQK